MMLFPQPPEVWDGGVGFVSKEMIQTHCPAPAPDIQVHYFFTFFASVCLNSLSILGLSLLFLI